MFNWRKWLGIGAIGAAAVGATYDRNGVDRKIQEEQSAQLSATVEALNLADATHLDDIQSTADSIGKVKFEDFVLIELLKNRVSSADAFLKAADAANWGDDLHPRARMYRDDLKELAEAASIVKVGPPFENSRRNLVESLLGQAKHIESHVGR